MISICGVLIAAGLGALFWKRLPRPAIPILVLWAVLAAWIALRSSGRSRAWSVAACSTFLTLAVSEGALELYARVRPTASAPAHRFTVTRWPKGILVLPDGTPAEPILGWRYAAGSEIRDVAPPVTVGPSADSCFSIGADGLRSGSDRAPSDAPVVAFFGDSFAFGLHLDDDSTLPYLLEERSRGVYDALNLSTPGWGPHQALALVERGAERPPLAGRSVALVVFYAVFDPLRPTGGRSWGRVGPRYVVDASGTPRYIGQIQHHASPRERVEGRSALAAQVGMLLGPSVDADLYVALVTRFAAIMRGRYGAPVVVVLGPASRKGHIDPAIGPDAHRPVVDRLRSLGIDAWALESLLPEDPGAIYWIPNDGHPTRLANERLAERLLAELGR